MKLQGHLKDNAELCADLFAAREAVAGMVEAVDEDDIGLLNDHACDLTFRAGRIQRMSDDLCKAEDAA